MQSIISLLCSYRLVVIATLISSATIAWSATAPIPAAPQLGAESFIMVDFESGMVLAEKDSDARVEPASITKLMTAYVVFQEIKSGNMSLEETVHISRKAWSMEGSRMFVDVNSNVPIEELLKGLIVQSGNDAAVALAEHVAGSEEVFASMMNQHAKRLGMTNTHYTNAAGLDDPEHYTTARDVSKMASALIRDFPKLYEWYSIKEFTYNEIVQRNRNALLWRDPAVDGLKTGYTDEAGYCLAASAKRGDMRLITAVMGTDSERARADDTQKLLNYGFRFFETHKLYSGGEELAQGEVWKGDAESVSLGIKDDLIVTVPRGQYRDLDAIVDVRQVITAPIVDHEELGKLKITLGGETLVERPLLALSGVPEGGFWSRISDSVALWFHDFSDDE